MSSAPLVFSATGTVQSFVVPGAGTYVIEAAGGEGGAGATPGGKGARVSGMFHLKRGESLKIVAGRQGAAASPTSGATGIRGGSSLVWAGAAELPNPIKLLLSARGGRGAGATPSPPSAVPFAPGEATDSTPAVDARELAASAGDLDASTADSLATVWTAGAGLSAPRASSGTEPADRSGYNAGAFRRGTPGVQSGHGYVSITPVAVPVSPPVASDSTPASSDSASAATASVPSTPTVLPPVTPRPSSWGNFLRRRP